MSLPRQYGTPFYPISKDGGGSIREERHESKIIACYFPSVSKYMFASVDWDLLYSSTRGKPLSAVGWALILLCSSIVCLFDASWLLKSLVCVLGTLYA